MLHRDASNIMCQPKYMTTLNRKQCSALFKYKSRMLNVKGNFPGSSNDTLCTYCNAGPETQQHIMMECTGFDDLTGEANLNQLDENQNLDFKKEADILILIVNWQDSRLSITSIFHSD